MRIGFILEHYHPYIGGAEKLFKSLAEGLVNDGHEVRVVTTRYSRLLPRRESIGGVSIRRVNAPGRYLFTLFSLPAALRVARWADLVHTTSYNAAWPAWIAARFRRKPIVITIHEVWGAMWMRVPFMNRLSRWLHRRFERSVVKRRYTRVVAVSGFTQRRLVEEGVDASRIRMIYNGLDYSHLSAHRTNPGERFRVAYFGRLGVSKGIDLLLDGWKLFSREHEEAQLLLIIPRRPRKLYRKVLQQLSRLGLDHSVDMLHELEPDVLWRTLAGASCVVIPSMSEGFCFSAAEAAALGVPVINSQRGALPEVVSGRFLEITPYSAEGLQQALNKANQAAWTAAGTKHFPVAEMIGAYADLYRDILG